MQPAMAKPTTIQILLIRAGATEWTETGRLQGETDLPLCPAGRGAVTDIAQTLREGDAPIVLSGPDEASTESASLIAAATGGKARVLQDLSEVSGGLWQGLLESELSDRFPKSYRQWREDPTAVSAPDGESIDDAEARILASLARAVDKAPKGPVAVVLRPMAYAIARCWLQDRPASEAWEALEDAPAIDRYEATRARFKDLLQELKAGA